MTTLKPDDIDALLPQTQCGLCGYGGCMPYAKAIVHDDAAINLCPPGGVATLKVLANKLNQDATPFISDMQQKAKPTLVARIKEDECIGCTKCISACPVDAIIGSAKQMHVIVTSQCTGCELCIPPCPVDCIELLATGPVEITTETRNQNRQRYHKKLNRLQRENEQKELKKNQREQLSQKKNYILEAIERANKKKREINDR